MGSFLHRAFLKAAALLALATAVTSGQSEDLGTILAKEEPPRIFLGDAEIPGINHFELLADRERAAALISRDDEPLAWAEAQHRVAFILYKLARHAEAVELLQKVVAIKERELGSDDSSLATSLSNMACSLEAQIKIAEAVPLYRRALEIDEARLGKGHSYITLDLDNLANLLHSQDKRAEAEALYRRALELDEARLGKDHRALDHWRWELMNFLRNPGRQPEAEKFIREAIAIDEARPGNVLSYHRRDLAELLRAEGRLSEAEPLFRELLEIDERKLGKNDPEVATSINDLATLLRARGRTEEAEPLYHRMLEIAFLFRKQKGKPFINEEILVNNFSRFLKDQGRSPEQIAAEILVFKKKAGLVE